MDFGKPSAGLHPRRGISRPLGAGVASRQSPRQRGDHPDGGKGRVELAATELGHDDLPRLLHPAGAGEPAPCAVPERLPEPAAAGGVGSTEDGPRGDPPHRDPERHRPRVPELDRQHPGRHAAPQHVDPTLVEPEHPRPARWRSCRVPEREASLRRRDEHRAVAGVTYALVDPSFTPDAAAGLLYDVVDPASSSPSALSAIGVTFQSQFPYLSPGWDGFEHPEPTGVLLSV